MDERVLLEVCNVSKSFPGVKALNNVSIKFLAGRVHAIAGENGAGKSTLMNIISGAYQPDQGKLFWNGNEIKIKEPLYAQKMGIAMIHQENSLLPHLNVQENIFIGHFFKKRLDFVDYKTMAERAKNLLKSLGIDYINTHTLVKNLSAAEKQLVEIAKAISLEPKLIIMDEPTASLTPREVKILMNIIKDLKEKGVAIVYISHRLEEVFEIADEISVLRDGVLVKTDKKEYMNKDKLIALMVGRKLEYENINDINLKFIENKDKTNVILSVKNATQRNTFENINFELYKGEILGFAGLVGAGRSELMEAIYGYKPLHNGEIYVENKKVKITNPYVAIQNGLCMIPEERKLKGLFLDLTVKENINITNLANIKKGMFINKKLEVECANKYVDQLKIKTPNLIKKIKFLSGGNQQKAIIARFLSINPKILILDEPTHGIDVGAKEEIYQIIYNLASKGVGIILISSELPELLRLCNRIAVMKRGKLMTILERNEFTQENIMSYAC